jgi:hypothetical protein
MTKPDERPPARKQRTFADGTVDRGVGSPTAPAALPRAGSGVGAHGAAAPRGVGSDGGGDPVLKIWENTLVTSDEDFGAAQRGDDLVARMLGKSLDRATLRLGLIAVVACAIAATLARLTS